MLYWLAKGAIYRGHMDGSICEHLRISTTGSVIALHVDQSSNALYFVTSTVVKGRGTPSFQIAHAGLDGQNAQVLVRLAEEVKQLQTAGNHIFWLSNSTQTLFSCRKTSADGLKKHEFKSGKGQGLSQFYLIHSDTQPTKREMINPCAGNLCSHICVPTPTGYMRCLCPAGLELLPDGWTCSPPLKDKPKTLSAKAGEKSEGTCHQDHFPCISTVQCIHMKLFCNGMKDCDDFSDEGPRKAFIPYAGQSSYSILPLLFDQKAATSRARVTMHG